MINIKPPEGEILDENAKVAMEYVLNSLIGLRAGFSDLKKKNGIFFRRDEKIRKAGEEIAKGFLALRPQDRHFVLYLAHAWSVGEPILSAVGNYKEEATFLVQLLISSAKTSDGRTPSHAELNKSYVELGLDQVWV